MTGLSVTPYDPLFASAGTAANVDPNLLAAQAAVESSYDPSAVSPAGAQGLMQLMPATAKAVGVTNPMAPAQSIAGGAKLMNQLLTQYGNVPDALRAYNAGAPANWQNSQTEAYVGKVQAAYQDILRAGGIQYAQADTGDATDAGSAPILGRPSDAAMMQMLTGGAGGAPAASTSSAPSSSAVAPIAGRPSDAAMMQMLTGGAQSPAAPTAIPAAVPQGSAGSAPDTAPTAVGALLTGGLDAYRGIARSLANGASWVDNRVPFLASADNFVGLNPQQVSSGILADIQADRQKYGSGPAYVAGNVGGNVLATLPMMALGGAGLGALGDAASSIPGVGNLLAAGGSAARAVPGGSAVSSLISNGAKGALQGAGAAATTSGASNQPVMQQIKQGAEFGGVAGAAVPALVGAGRDIITAARGGTTDAATAALAQQAQRYGIPITLGQLSDNASIRALDSMSKRVPFSGSDSQAAAQQAAFNRAVGGTIGQPVDKITPQVMSTARAQIGATLNQIENSNVVSLDGPFLSEVAAIEKNARLSLTDPEYNVVSRQLDNILTNLQPGDTITGQTYGNLIHKGSPLDAALNSRDSNVANYAGQIKGALQDALTRSLSPADQAAYTQARYQYKNLKTIEDLAEKSTTGDISPAGLMQAVRSSYGDMAYTGGGGDLGNLARIGQRFLKEPPDSGTAGRLSALEAMTRLGATAGGVLTGATHPGDAAALGLTGLGTIGAARAARAYLGSRSLAAGLVQRGLNPGSGTSIGNMLSGAATTTSPTVAALIGNRPQPGQRNAQGR